MTAVATTTSADRFIRRVGRLQAIPQVTRRILSLTRDPEFDMDEIVRCIEHDPALAAKILRVVNSSRYGLSHRIGSIRHAATYLGRRTLRLTAVTFSLVESLTRGGKGTVYADYWRRALTIATVASCLARRDPRVDEEDAYSGGLLADIGVLVISQSEGRRYEAVYGEQAHGTELIESERELLGFGHPDLGARLLEHWALPPALVGAVANHHLTNDHLRPLDSAVRAGDAIATAVSSCTGDDVRTAAEIFAGGFGLDRSDVVELLHEARLELDESVELFSVPAQPLDEFERLLAIDEWRSA